MDWSKGFSSNFYAVFVDAESQRDLERFEIKGGKITKSNEGLRVSADIDCLNYNQNRERWIRVYLDTRQEGSAEHIALFTGIASNPQREINGVVVDTTLECYSVLKPCEDILLQRGWYASANVPATSIISGLLKATPAIVEIEPNQITLSQPIIAEDGETNLSMIEKILNAINWRMVITGNGVIEVKSKPSDYLVKYDALDNDSIEPKIKALKDWFKCPNVFRAIKDDLTAVVKDTDDDSPLSIQNRGREVWFEETDCNLNDGETISEYALRRLKEEQSVIEEISYSRRFNPLLNVSDVVRLHYPKQEIDGDFKINHQSINIGNGVKVEEEVSR